MNADQRLFAFIRGFKSLQHIEQCRPLGFYINDPFTVVLQLSYLLIQQIVIVVSCKRDLFTTSKSDLYHLRL